MDFSDIRVVNSSLDCPECADFKLREVQPGVFWCDECHNYFLVIHPDTLRGIMTDA